MDLVEKYSPPPRKEISSEELQNQKISDIQKELYHIVHVLNEQITDLRGEINHIKKYGDKAGEIQRDKIILQNYFSLNRK